MKIPKGGLHNINQSSQANINDSWNVLATDENNAVLIAVDKCGTKKTVGDTTEIKNSIQALEQENIEQDNRLTDIESENIIQYDLINDLQTSLNNKLHKGTYTGTAQDLKNDIDSKASMSHTHNISDINNLQTSLNNKLEKGIYSGTAEGLKNDIETKQKKLSSFDESILIEPDGNIEGNVSLFTEYFEQQVCELNFIPIQIIGVYQDGIKLLNSEYEIILPKKIKIKEYVDEDIQIEYTHLKS